MRSDDVACRGQVGRRRPGTIEAPGLSPGRSRTRSNARLGWYPARAGPTGSAPATPSVRRSTGTAGRRRRIQDAAPPSPVGCGAMTSLVEARWAADARVRSEPRGFLQVDREQGRTPDLDGTRRGRSNWLSASDALGPPLDGDRGASPSNSRRRPAVPGRRRSNDASCRSQVDRRRPGTILEEATRRPSHRPSDRSSLLTARAASSVSLRAPHR